MNVDTLVELSNVSRFYGRVCAVDNLSFSVNRGEVLGFLGPNGAGKSTTMAMICGALAPHAGRILVGNHDVVNEPLAAKRLLGYLPEHPPLYPEHTVDEYLLFCARLHGLTKRAALSACTSTKVKCGLEEIGTRLIGNLSKGYQQRVGIAQAILHNPAVIILDEPTVGLDPHQIRSIRSLIRELANDHSVVLSTHILPEVQAVCERVLIMHEGRCVFDQRLDALGGPLASIRIGLQRPPPSSQLTAIEKVQKVETQDNNLFRLHYEPDPNFVETLARLCLDNDWGLFELQNERQSLEEIFINLTLHDAAAETVGVDT